MQLAIPLATYKGVRALRAQAALFERHRGFDRCMRKLNITADEPVPMATLAELYAHWGDPLSQGAESYLRSCLAEAARATGPIVQCGASLLTLVLGSMSSATDRPGKQVWCLEHDTHWASVVRSWLTQYRIGSAHVITSRAQLFGEYVWYGVDCGRLADKIALLLCDGARATPQGIIGALHRLGDRLAPDCTVLARKIARAEDLKALNAWAKSHGASCVIVDRQEGFVKIARRSAGTSDALT